MTKIELKPEPVDLNPMKEEVEDDEEEDDGEQQGGAEGEENAGAGNGANGDKKKKKKKKKVKSTTAYVEAGADAEVAAAAVTGEKGSEGGKALFLKILTPFPLSYYRPYSPEGMCDSQTGAWGSRG